MLLALVVAGVLVGLFAAIYLHASPSQLVAGASTQSNSGPVVDLELTTVAQVGSGPHPNWVSYLPTTFFKVPPSATVRVTIHQQDGPSGLRNPYIGLVRGTIDNQMTVNDKPMQAIDPTLAAHTFSVPDLGVSVPLLGVDPAAPSGSENKVVFSFKVPASGSYHWQCFVPCAAGTLYGNGGPMQTLGYMDGQIEIGS
jgi:hypothetical protein